MIDTVNLHINIKPPPEVTERIPEPFIWQDITFAPIYTLKGFIRSYSGRLNNLYLTFTDFGLFLGNSWHKYYHGKNWNDYTFPEIVATYEALNDRFNGLLENATINRLDYGINLTSEPAETFNRWAYYKGKEPDTMKYKRHKYGKKFMGYKDSEYSFKGYDKTAEVKYQTRITLPKQIIRIEKSVNKMRNLNRRKRERIPIYTAKDLSDRNIIRQLANDFLKTYKNIEQMENINLTGLTATEKKIFAAMQNTQVREAMKKENLETYRKDMRTYQDILKRKKTENRTTEMITEKVMNLVNA